MLTHSITLDMRKEPGIVPPRVTVRRGESLTQKIVASLTDNGTSYAPSYQNARLCILHANGTWARCSAAISSSTVTVTLTSAMLNGAGRAKLAYFEFYSSNGYAETTEGFELVILGNVDTEGSKEAANYEDELSKLWAKWNTYEQLAESQENARVTAEAKRAASESARVSAENTRAASESARAEAESGRITAENARIGAETSRVNAETAREASFDEAIEEANTAIEDAEKVNATLSGTSFTVTNRNGVSTTIDIKGEKGDKGDQGEKGDKGDSSQDTIYNAQLILGTYEGRDLNTVFADEIDNYTSDAEWFNARIIAGNFTGIRIFDYFDITLTDGKIFRYRVAAIDPYLHAGDTEITKHHIIMVPDQVWPDSIVWNTTNTNQGTASEKHPYLCSNLHTWETNTFYALLPTKWKNVLATHRAILEERYSASSTLTASTSWSWADVGKVFSLSETEVYGQEAWGTKGYSVGIDCHFDTFFKHTKHRIREDHSDARRAWWLRTPSGVSAASACSVSANGGAYSTTASNAYVRALPCFRVGV